MKIIPVILSGGSGTRLWPLSRKQYPKQYLPLMGEHTMLQETILRLNGIDNLGDLIVVCSVDHRFLVAQQLQAIKVINPTILLEPVGRNTAPAIVASVLNVADKASVLLILSADHIIQDVAAFHHAIKIALCQAQNNILTIFGIVPTNANTGYGYIHKGDMLNESFQVKKFIEKPNQTTVNRFFKSGDYLWNSGMFMFKASVFLEEMNIHAPDIVSIVKQSIVNATQDLDFIRLGEEFSSLANDSIDYALMEKTNNVVVVPLDVGWSDIGSWDSLYNANPKDADGNVIMGDVINLGSTNSYINANHHIVATIGVDNLIIVDTPNATLVASKDRSQEVKTVVEKLQADNRNEQIHHRKVYRPWGWYDSIEVGDNFQVKRLHIRAGAKLSLQSHQQRAEHWVVIFGVASVVNGEESFKLEKGQSTYISLGVKHSLANNTDEELEIIEVQSGVYLGEDDIQRFEDIYGRIKYDR